MLVNPSYNSRVENQIPAETETDLVAAHESDAAKPNVSSEGTPQPENAEASADAEVTEANVSSADDSGGAADGSASQGSKKSGRGSGHGRADAPKNEATIPLRRLVDLTVKYPDIGPPLADLAFAIGQNEIAESVLKMGMNRENPSLEYWIVGNAAARRRKQTKEALSYVLDAVKLWASLPTEQTENTDPAAQASRKDEDERLLHLVRQGYAVLLFDEKDLNAQPEFLTSLLAELPKLETRMGQNPFFRTLMAQTLWTQDKEASEKEWDRAAELGDPETTWNARGTWYKEVDKDLDKAEATYRKGLELLPKSPLLLLNVAQVLLAKAGVEGIDPGQARRFLNQSDDLIRRALREDAPRLRRHIFSARDRLFELRRKYPGPDRNDRNDRNDGQHRGYNSGVGHRTGGPTLNGQGVGGLAGASGGNDRRYANQGNQQNRRPMPSSTTQPGAHLGSAQPGNPPASGDGQNRGPAQNRDARPRPNQNTAHQARPFNADRRPRNTQDRPRQEASDNRRPDNRESRPPKNSGDKFLQSGTVSLADLIRAKLKETE